MPDTPPARVRFGSFELDLRSGELCKGEVTTLLREQPLQILRMLIARPREIVTRDEIRNALWGDDVIVDFDQSINAAIRNLRRALGDSADEPEYIETLARRGYRLMVPVERVEASPEHPIPDQVEDENVDWGELNGRTVSHYRVLNIIGGGGMGRVYRAEDLRLGRQVALKFLPEELAWDTTALQRFEREARTASSLDHPNICPIYEFGEHKGQPFIAMQLLEGRTLRDRLARSSTDSRAFLLAELLDVGTQICDGLQAAHEAGIIHRDIKPANLFLTSKGVAKILDFGLVKLLEGGDDDDGPPAPQTPPALPSAPEGMHLTRPGSALGTAAYMSPEQARGEPLDARTDLFSFGLVLYEMATGRLALSGNTTDTRRNNIEHGTPVPLRELNPTLPERLEEIIDKALQKDRELRHQSAAELRADLQQLKTQRKGWLFRNGELNKQRIAWSALSVLLLVFLLAKLVPRVENFIQNWRVPGGTFNPAAHKEYLKGEAYLARYDVSGNVDRAIESLTKATQLDPHYALAFAALGGARWWKAQDYEDSHEKELALNAIHESLRLAPDLAEGHVRLGEIYAQTGHIPDANQEEWSALRIAPGNAEAYRVLGGTYLANGQYDQAEAAYREAVRRQPDDWYALLMLGIFYRDRGRYSEAHAAFDAALKLTPDNEILYRNLAVLDMREGRFHDASDMIAKALNFKPRSRTYLALGAAYYYQRRYTEAAAAYNAGIQLNPGVYTVWGDLGEVYQHLPGGQKQAQEAFQKAIDLAGKHLAVTPEDYNARANLAEYWAYLGRREEALAEIDKIPVPSRAAFADRIVLAYELTGDRHSAVEMVRALPPNSPLLTFIKYHPDLGALWSDPAIRD